MYGAKCMLVGLLVGVVIGSSSNLVQKHMKAMCKCSKDLVDDTNDKIQEVQSKIDNIDVESIKKEFSNKIEQLKNMLDGISSSLSKEEIQQKVKEVSEKVNTLFQEIKQGLNI